MVWTDNYRTECRKRPTDDMITVSPQGNKRAIVSINCAGKLGIHEVWERILTPQHAKVNKQKTQAHSRKTKNLNLKGKQKTSRR